MLKKLWSWLFTKPKQELIEVDICDFCSGEIKPGEEARHIYGKSFHNSKDRNCYRKAKKLAKKGFATLN